MIEDRYTIARRYAAAVFALAKDKSALDSVGEDLRSLSDLAEKDKDFSRFLASPLLPRKTKSEALQAVLIKGKAHDLTVRFTKQLAHNARLSVLPEIAAAFMQMLMEAKGQVHVEATSAAPLSEQQKATLVAALKKHYGKDPLIETSINPALIGGVVIKVGDILLDYSVAGQFNRLSNQLKQLPISKAAQT